MFYIAYHIYYEDEDFIEPEDGGHSWCDDHYEPFAHLSDAERALPFYQKIDEDAHIFEMDE